MDSFEGSIASGAYSGDGGDEINKAPYDIAVGDGDRFDDFCDSF